MTDTGAPYSLPYLLAADPPAIHTITQALALATQTAIGKNSAGLQEGVIDAGSYEVTQASGGASTTVDVASNIGTGAYVQNDSGTGQALYYVTSTALKTSVTITAAHATLPRVDAVVVSLAGVVSIVAGTATSGATLDNARDGSHGGAAIPSSALHLADLLVPATDTTISNSQIRDRRKWARGAFKRIERTSGDYAIVATAQVDATNLNPRIECAGNPMRISLVSKVATSSSIVNQPELTLRFTVDGSAVGQFAPDNPGPNIEVDVDKSIVTTPAAGSHVFGVQAVIVSGTMTVRANSTDALQLVVEEIVRQDTANNATTSG